MLFLGANSVFLFNMLAQMSMPTDVGTIVNGFQDNFGGATLDPNWVVSGANAFSVGSGLLHVSTAGGDPNHLLYELPRYDNTVQEVLARVRILSFGAGDASRGGIAVGVDPGSSQGINYLFRNNSSEGQTGNHLAFLDDARAWGPGQGFAWLPNQWYWLRLRHEPDAASLGGLNDVFSKAWPDDGTTTEPPDWQLTWDYTPGSSTRTGFAGITATSSTGVGQFDVDYILIKASGLPSIQVAPDLGSHSGSAAPSFPAAQTVVPGLRSIEVHFNQAVTGVVARDLLINNLPATALTAYAPWQYVFNFPEPGPGDVEVSWSTNAAIRSLAGQTNVSPGGDWSYTLDRRAPPPSLLISEFLAANQNSLLDQDGASSDWIEIYNGTLYPVNLAGWFLTTQPTNLMKWPFPDYVLAAGDYLVVFASGKDRRSVTNELHTNFRLSAQGGFLALVDSNTNLVSSFAPTYPSQQTDISYGCDPLLFNDLGYFANLTPGNANATAGPGFAPEPEFSRVGGAFVKAFPLNISAASTNALVRFTLDGSLPTDFSPIFTGSLAITNSLQVRARAFAPGLMPGPIHSESYVLLSPAVATARSDLPILVIHNFGAGPVPIDPGADYQSASFCFYEPVNGQTSLTNAPALSARAGFHVRGSSTRYMPKQAWSVQFWDEFNHGLDLSPLELPADKDWALYAPDSFEPVLIHNPLAYQLSNEVGRYAPRTRFLEVYINTSGGAVTPADYNGIYVLEEKIKRGKSRVDIDKLKPDDNAVPAVTGGYMLSIDRLGPGESGFGAAGQTIVYDDPAESDILAPERAPQAKYIQNYMTAFGNALNGPNYTSSTLGYQAYIDVDSWIDHHILNVLTFNVDTLRLSAYFHKPRQGKIFFGPVWDFDRTQGSTDGRDFSPFYWRAPVPDYGTDFFNYTWWGRLFTDIDFWQKWIDRYENLRTGVLSTNHVFADIDALAGQVRQAQPREAARWSGYTTPRSGLVSISGYSFNFPGTYQGEVDFLKRWYRDRLYFMDTNFVAKPVLSSNGGPIPAGGTLTMTGPAGATIYYTTDGSDPRLPRGGFSSKATVYQSAITLSASAAIVARCYNPAHRNLTGANNPPLSSPWSGYTAATFGLVSGPTQVLYTNAGSIYAQAFDSLPNPGAASVEAANPVTMNGLSYSLDNPFGFAVSNQTPGGLGGLGLPSSLNGWYGSGTLTAKFGASEGDQSTGGIISFGSTNSSTAANRALGLLATSSTGSTAFGVRFVNATGYLLNTISLHFTGELWRQSVQAKHLAFGYFIDPVTTNSFSTNATAFLPALEVGFPADPAAVTPVPVDGTAPANQLDLSVTNQPIADWPPGAALWLVWQMTDNAAKGQGIAIDNLTFSSSLARPGLSIQALGSKTVLTWPYGHLQSATNVNGPFTILGNASSPFTNGTEAAVQFYRVEIP